MDRKQFAKFISRYSVKRNPTHVIIDKQVYINPTWAHLKEAGYKELVEKERPEEKEGYTLTPVYVDKDEIIVQDWEYTEIPVMDTEL